MDKKIKTYLELLIHIIVMFLIYTYSYLKLDMPELFALYATATSVSSIVDLIKLLFDARKEIQKTE